MHELAIIFFAQIVYVSLVTVRWIILVRGARYLASAMSFFEILIYAYTLTLVVGNLSDPRRLVVYAAGYAVGCLVGSWVEGKLAYGTAAVQCILPHESELASRLRESGFAGTEWAGSGRDSGRRLLLVVLKRRQMHRLVSLIDTFEPTAVMMELEPRSLKGAYLSSAA
jgi:uncharacterized protein YebE (UPF0316 family)